MIYRWSFWGAEEFRLITVCRANTAVSISDVNKNRCPIKTTVSLCHTDYVCVLDIDLLELAITTWKGSDTGKLVSAHHLFTYLYFLHSHTVAIKHHSKNK